MAAEYVAKEGNERVILCERGIKTFERSTRYTLDLSAVPVLKRETHLPGDRRPVPRGGRSDLVLPLARAAVAAGADGVMVEVHPQPEDALCDGPQQIRVGEFARFADEIAHDRRADGQDRRLTPAAESRQPDDAHRARAGPRGARRRARRQVDLASRGADRRDLRGRDADLRVRALGRHGGDDRGRPRARGRGRRARRRHARRPRSRASAGSASRPPHRLRQRGNAHAAPRRDPGRAGRPLRARRRRVALGAPDGARRRAASADGRDGRDDRRARTARRRGRAAAGDRLRASRAVGAGEVRGPPRGAPRRRRDTTVVEPLPTRDHTERLLERAGAAVERRPKSVSVRKAERLVLGERRDPRRLLLGGAAPRRGGDRPWLDA